MLTLYLSLFAAAAAVLSAIVIKISGIRKVKNYLVNYNDGIIEETLIKDTKITITVDKKSYVLECYDNKWKLFGDESSSKTVEIGEEFSLFNSKFKIEQKTVNGTWSVAIFVAVIAFVLSELVIISCTSVMSGEADKADNDFEILEGTDYEKGKWIEECDKYEEDLSEEISVDEENKESNLREARRNILVSGTRYSLGINEEGKIEATGNYISIDDGEWGSVVSLAGMGSIIAGLTEEGRVFSKIIDGNNKDYCDTSGWDNIIDIDAGDLFLIGLNSEGDVIGVGHGADGQLAVNDWNNVVDVACGCRFSVGLTQNHELLICGYNSKKLLEEYCEVKDSWKDVIAISANGGGKGASYKGTGHIVGLTREGTVVAVGDNRYGQCDVESWENVVSVVAGDWYTVGLTKEGEILITGQNEPGMRYIDESMTGINSATAISAGFGQTIVVMGNGEVLPFGFDDDGKCSDTRKWSKLVQFDVRNQYELQKEIF